MNERPAVPKASKPGSPPAWVSIDEKASAPLSGEAPASPELSKRKRAILVAAFEAALFIAGILVGVLFTGGKKQAPEAPPAVESPVVAAAPEPVGRERAALRALEEARAHARENPQDLRGQVERFLVVAKEWEGTSSAAKAREEAEQVPSRWRNRLLGDLVDIEERAAGHEGREEFRDALAVLEDARDRYDDPFWGQAIALKIGDLRGRVEALYLSLRPAAERAAEAEDEDGLAKIRERVRGWGLEDVFREFDRTFGGPAPASASSPLTPARNAYLSLWERAAGFAVIRDYDAAAAELKGAARSLKDEDLRHEAGEDLRDVQRVGTIYDGMRQAFAAWPRGGAVDLALSDGRKVSGSVCRGDRDRFEVLPGPGEETVFVEYSAVSAASLAGLFEGRSRGQLPDARALALFCLLDGDAEAARARLEGKEEALPEKYWRFGRKARSKAAKPDPTALRNEEAARKLYCEAEREYRDPGTRARAVEKYRALLRDFLDQGPVLRAMDRITRRAEPRSEHYFSAADMEAGGTFRPGRRPPHGSCWVTAEETAFAQARENYVEIEFHAPGGAPVRLWIQAGGCCAESFPAYYQATGLTSPHAKKPGETVHVEPGSIYGLTLRVPESARKEHPGHGAGDGTEAAVHWEWIEVPLPAYDAAGAKKVRVMTNRRGLCVARALASTTRKAPPKEAEVAEFEAARAADLGIPADPDLVGHWEFDEGAGRLAGDASGRGHLGTASGEPSWEEGVTGTALGFDGKDDYVLIQDSLDLRIRDDVTLAFWVRYGSEAKGRHRLAGKGEENYGVWGSAGNRLLFQQCDSLGRPVLSVASKAALKAGEWHHVAAVVRGNKGYLYIDGREDASGDREGLPGTSRAPVSLGFSGQEGHFAGRLDDVRIYGRALGPDEIKSLAAPK